MVFINEFVPNEEEAIKSILDYQINIDDLRPDQTHYMALGMNYSVAGFQMVLHRKISFYIGKCSVILLMGKNCTLTFSVTYYLPSGLFVVVSWISFLVNPEVIPGRMTLLVTIFLVLINIFNTIQTNSPKAEGLTAIGKCNLKTLCTNCRESNYNYRGLGNSLHHFRVWCPGRIHCDTAQNKTDQVVPEAPPVTGSKGRRPGYRWGCGPGSPRQSKQSRHPGWPALGYVCYNGLNDLGHGRTPDPHDDDNYNLVRDSLRGLGGHKSSSVSTCLFVFWQPEKEGQLCILLQVLQLLQPRAPFGQPQRQFCQDGLDVCGGVPLVVHGVQPLLLDLFIHVAARGGRKPFANVRKCVWLKATKLLNCDWLMARILKVR